MFQKYLATKNIAIAVVGLIFLVPLACAGLLAFDIWREEKIFQEMDIVEEEFLQAYPLEELGDNVSMSINRIEKNIPDYYIHIKNVTDMEEREKITQILEDITEEHVYFTPDVTLCFSKNTLISDELGEREVYVRSSRECIPLIVGRLPVHHLKRP